MKKIFSFLSFCILLAVKTQAQNTEINPNYLKVPVVSAIPTSPPINSEGRMVFVNMSGNKQLYVWNGTTWAAVAGAGGGSLTPPINLTGTGNVLTSNSSGGSGRGLLGTGDSGTGVEGNVGNGTGVAGYSNGGTAIYGQSASGSGGIFQSSSNTNSTLFANTSGTGGTAIFFNDAPTSTKPTLRLGNQGNGRTLEVLNDGKGFSGFFENQNAGATAPTLYAGTYSSTQPAAHFVGTNALKVDGLSNFNGGITATNGFRKTDANATSGKALMAINIYGDTQFANYITMNEMFTTTRYGYPPDEYRTVVFDLQGPLQGFYNNSATDGGVIARPFNPSTPSVTNYFMASTDGIFCIDFSGKWAFDPVSAKFRVQIKDGVTGIVSTAKIIGTYNVLNPSFRTYFVAHANDIITLEVTHNRNIPLPFFYPCGDPFGILPPCPSVSIGNALDSASATIIDY